MVFSFYIDLKLFFVFTKVNFIVSVRNSVIDNFLFAANQLHDILVGSDKNIVVIRELIFDILLELFILVKRNPEFRTVPVALLYTMLIRELIPV